VLDEKNIIDLSLVDKFVMKVFVRVYQSDRHKPFIALLINKKGKFNKRLHVRGAYSLPASSQRNAEKGWCRLAWKGLLYSTSPPVRTVAVR
jgi:hypothetical protein